MTSAFEAEDHCVVVARVDGDRQLHRRRPLLNVMGGCAADKVRAPDHFCAVTAGQRLWANRGTMSFGLVTIAP